jgi:hypothetical protein
LHYNWPELPIQPLNFNKKSQKVARHYFTWDTDFFKMQQAVGELCVIFREKILISTGLNGQMCWILYKNCKSSATRKNCHHVDISLGKTFFAMF